MSDGLLQVRLQCGVPGFLLKDLHMRASGVGAISTVAHCRLLSATAEKKKLTPLVEK